MTETQRDIATIENGLFRIEAALHIADSVALPLFHAGCAETVCGEKALSHAVGVGAKARRRLARLKEKMGQPAPEA